MALCMKCGAEVSPDSPFCGSCGAPVAGAEAAPAQAAVPTPPPPAAGAPAYGPPMAPPGPGFQPPKSGGGAGKAVLFSLIGLLVVGVIVVLILGFAGPKWFVGDDGNGGGSASSGPEKVVDTFLKAMEQKDAKLLISTISPSSIGDLEDQTGDYYTDLEELFNEVFFTYESVKFSGIKYKTTIDGDTATVEIVEGTYNTVDEYGDKETGNIEDSDTPAEFPMIKENGEWYIDFENM